MYAAAGCWIRMLEPINFDVSPYSPVEVAVIDFCFVSEIIFHLFILFALLRVLSTEVAFKFSIFLLCVYIIFTRFFLCLSLSSSILYLIMSISVSCLSSGFIQYSILRRFFFFVVCLNFCTLSEDPESTTKSMKSKCGRLMFCIF